MKQALGRTRWAIAEGYIPEGSNGPKPEMESHETACLLNTGEVDANVTITAYFAGRRRVPSAWWSPRSEPAMCASIS